MSKKQRTAEGRVKKSNGAQFFVRERPNLLPRNLRQQEYMRAIHASDITFGIGPAGTGKTFIPAALAARELDLGNYDRIVICRPIVEASDEKLGFLPGTMEEKCDPYLRPIFDAISTYWDAAEIDCKRKRGQIEISPLAYMRGRTFINCFIVADEAQNMTEEQMFMLLTRFGEGSKMVITGDPEQRDKHTANGIEAARRKLDGCPAVSFVDFGVGHVVRHETVSNVLRRWSSRLELEVAA